MQCIENDKENLKTKDFFLLTFSNYFSQKTRLLHVVPLCT